MEPKKNVAPVTQEEVKKARETLKAQGKKVTYQAIRTTLGDRGSFGTIGRYLVEIENEEQLSAQSPVAKETLENIWTQVRNTVTKEFEGRLATAEERRGELEGELVRFESANTQLLKELEESNKRERAAAETLRRTLAELELSRAAQLVAEKGLTEAQNSEKEARNYAGDIKGVLAAISSTLADLSKNGLKEVSAIEKEVACYLSKLESVQPGQEARAVFLQIVEAEQTRREFGRLAAGFAAEREALIAEQRKLCDELATLRTSLAVAEESRRSMDREAMMHKQALERSQRNLEMVQERAAQLESQVNKLQSELLQRTEIHSRDLTALRENLHATLLENSGLKAEITKAPSKT